MSAKVKTKALFYLHKTQLCQSPLNFSPIQGSEIVQLGELILTTTIICGSLLLVHYVEEVWMFAEERFSRILNLQQYQEINDPLRVRTLSPLPDSDEQMILRMLVEAPYSKGLQLPTELLWTLEIIETAKQFQKEIIRIAHPFIYVTVRHGVVTSVTDDEWHVDGFSMKYSHLPEANYLFTLGEHPTQFTRQSFVLPDDFDPLKHNIHTFFQGRVEKDNVRQLDAGTLYLVDPYVVHRRPPLTQGIHRTFVRISFTPIEIPDVNNTENPLIRTDHYVTDGVKDFRDHLIDYDEV